MDQFQDLPDLTINVKENQDEVFKLLAIIKPGWKKEQVKIKLLSGGYSCCMLRCSDQSGESVTVRVRSNLEGLRNPEPERIVIKVMSSKGYFPPLLATFQNGFCYQYIPGRPFLQATLNEFTIDENQTRLVARQMANIHLTTIPEFDFSKTSYFDFFCELLDTSKTWFEKCPSIDELKEELKIVQELASEVGSPLILLHGDAHPANMVWNEKENKITFVDWEMTQVAPRACDIAYFLRSFDNFAGIIMKGPLKIPNNIERLFGEFYLQRWNEIKGKPSPTEEEIKQILREIQYYSMVAHFAWMIYFVKFENVMAKFSEVDCSNYWDNNVKYYLNFKEEITGVRRLGQIHL